MLFKHIYEEGLAQASYLIGCQATGEAIVIDPRRDINIYLEIAQKEKVNIKYVTETHIHADFLSGAKELANVTGAELLLSGEGGNDWKYQFPHKELKNGDKIKVGNLILEVMHTPGHTPEHISFLLTDTPASDKPVMIFTGDFVFVGDVGRPDLLEKAAGITGTMEKGAKDLFNSLKKFKELPDYVQVWPGHGAGSACGKALGAVPSSTVGYEKLSNLALKFKEEKEFINYLLEGQPEPPKYFAMMKKLNKTGPDFIIGKSLPKRLSLEELKDAYSKGITIIDTRNKIDFGKLHLKGSINIQDNSAFSTWAGWILSYDKPFILLTNENRIEFLTKALQRIGLDSVYGFYTDFNLLLNSDFTLNTTKMISAEVIFENSDKYFILDVRSYSEFNSLRIKNAKNIHVGYLSDNVSKIPDEKEIVVHCAGGDRASIAVSLLNSFGKKNILNMDGGINGWIQKGFPVVSEN